MKLGSKLQDEALHTRLIAVAKEYLKDTSHQVKGQCLQLLSRLFPVGHDRDPSSPKAKEIEAILKLLGDYAHSQVDTFIQLVP